MDSLATFWSLFAWLGLLAAIFDVWRHRSHGGGWRFGALALIGFATTWTFMILLAREDLAKYPSFAAWGQQSNLFFEAYKRVTATPAAWWMSSQLMAWAMGITAFLHIEGVRRRIGIWSYLWVAMCVAVSVSLPLFMNRRRKEAVAEATPRVSWLVVICLVAASVSVVLTPLVEGTAFRTVMVVLHGSVIVAGVVGGRATGAGSPRAIMMLYGGCALLAAIVYWTSTAQLLTSVGVHAPGALVHAVASDFAQASISSDLILTSLIAVVFVSVEERPSAGILFLIVALFCSVGAAFLLYLIYCERRRVALATATAPFGVAA